MLLLPTFDARLNPCPVSSAEFTAHPQGHFCGQCQRVVHDFSQSTNPRADLAAARAAAPDGRVCGTFGRAQLVQPAAPKLSRRLRWFVAALVLVVAQGLSAREALAQVRRVAGSHRAATSQRKHKPVGKKAYSLKPKLLEEQGLIESGVILLPTDVIEENALKVYTSAEVMPTSQGKSYPEVVSYIQQRVRWPEGSGRIDAEGRVFVSFTVDTTGQVRDARILKSLHPLLDAEALRVVQALTGFSPGRQNGRPVNVSLTVPVTFKRD